MSEGLAASRPGVPTGLIVDVDDELTRDHSVCEGDDSRVTFELTVHNEARYQSFVNSAYIPDRVPNKLLAAVDFHFFVDSSHRVLLKTLIDTRTPEGITRSHLKNAFKGLYFCHLSGTFISVHAEVNRCHDAKN